MPTSTAVGITRYCHIEFLRPRADSIANPAPITTPTRQTIGAPGPLKSEPTIQAAAAPEAAVARMATMGLIDATGAAPSVAGSGTPTSAASTWGGGSSAIKSTTPDVGLKN